MRPKKLKGPKGPPLPSVRLGPVFSGSLKTSGQFKEVGNTLSWISVLGKKLGLSGHDRSWEPI